ncbi:hypothetical protein ACFL5S_01950, partial [Fibrobacterota bacterium]
MAYYPYLVQIAWDVVSNFIFDFQSTPYKWSKEIDIHTELASRIQSVYNTIGRNSIIGNYKELEKNVVGNQIWSRVSCEPYISYVYNDGKSYYCYPDIVIWDRIKNPNLPPEYDKNNWPILWACEIK